MRVDLIDMRSGHCCHWYRVGQSCGFWRARGLSRRGAHPRVLAGLLGYSEGQRVLHFVATAIPTKLSRNYTRGRLLEARKEEGGESGGATHNARQLFGAVA